MPSPHAHHVEMTQTTPSLPDRKCVLGISRGENPEIGPAGVGFSPEKEPSMHLLPKFRHPAEISFVFP